MEKEQNAIKTFLSFIGEDASCNNLLKTPQRMLEGYKNILSGYNVDAKSIIANQFSDACSNDIICFDEIDFFSICEHHILPFFGKIKIAYIPNKFAIGFNTITKLVDAVTRRLQLQEKIAKEIGDIIQHSLLAPLGVFVKIEAEHFCVLAKSQNSSKPFMVKNIYTTEDFKKTESLQKLNLIEKV